MRAVYAVFLIFIISFVIFPQEVIKEKVEIAPTVKNNKKVLGAQDHTLTIEYNWNLPERQGLVNVSFCGDWREDATRLSTGGTITESLNAPSGSYSIPCHAMINTGEECISTLKVYLDGNLVVDVQGGSDIEGSFETPYYDYFETWYSDPVSYGSNISPITIHTGKCTSTPLPYYFDDNDNMSISIVSGKEYALLAGDYNYSNLSDSVSFPIGNMPVIELDYFNPNLTTNNIDVIFQAYVNGNSKQYSVTIPPAQFSLYTYQYDDVVYHNATTSTYINFREESNTSAPSGSLTLSASIIRGSKYGVLVNPMTGDKGASLENIATSGGSLILNFEATGENPSIADTVIMHLVPSSASIAPVDIQWVIAPSPIYVTLVPDVLSPGDTANVVIKRKNIDGSTEDFPSDQEFEVSITGGCDGGELLVGDSLANYFSGVTQPVKFVASQSFTSDSIALQIRVGSNIGGGIASSIVKGKNKNAKAVSSALNKKKENYEKLLAAKIQARQKAKTADAGSCYAGEYRTNIFGTCEGGLTNNSPNILLGETKYYQARVNAGGKMQIEEVKPGSDGIPHLNGGITTDIWGNNPVTPVKSGENVGVYWEKEKPVWGTTQNLAKGLIRLIGRYWNKNNTNKFKLTAQSETGSVSIEIEIKKPNLLGNNKLANQYRNGITVYSQTYNVDDICIYWGGIYGIAPQFIKGQYVQEGVYDNKLKVVMPAYRYEPWSTEFSKRVEDLKNTSHFVVSMENNNMGDGSPVPDHQNTRYMSYETTPQSVWYFINRYTNIIQDPPPYGGNSLYGVKNSTGRLVFSNYKIPKYEYDRIRKTVYKELNILTELEDFNANQKARLRFIEYMSKNFNGGLVNRSAQSRIASSYGPLQIMYTTALDCGYPQSLTDIPENLNVLEDFFPFALKYFNSLLNVESNNQDNNWDDGYENIMKATYHDWNRYITNYDINVIKYGIQFNPQ